MQKSLSKNYFYSLVYQVLTLITPFITTPYVSRVLGVEGVGVSSYVTSVVFYFTLIAALGTATIGQREVAYKRDSVTERSIAFWNAESLNILMVFLACIIYYTFCMFQTENILYYKILMLNIITVAVDIVWFFQGLEEFKKIVIRNIIFKIVGIAYIFIFVQTANDVDVYILGASLTAFLSALSLWGYLPNYIKHVSWRKLHLKETFYQSLLLFIPTLAVSFYVVLDKLMIGWFTLDYVENGNYEQAMKITKMSLAVIFSLAAVMTPRISYCFQKKDFGAVCDYMYKSYRFLWLISLPICFGLWSISYHFVPWFFGPDFVRVAPLLCLLALLVPIQGITVISGGQFLVSIREERHYTYSVIMGAFTNLILNLFLIPRYFAMGAALSSIMGEIVVASVQLYYVRRSLSLANIIKSSRNYLLASTIMFIILYLVGLNFHATVLATLIQVGLGVFIYPVTLIILHDSLAVTCIRRGVSVIRKLMNNV